MVERATSERCLVRLARVSFDTSGLEHLLDADERGRLERLVVPDDRRRFTAAAVLLRLTVASHLGASPSDVSIDRTCEECGRPHGRPQLRGSDRGVHMSVSHSGPLVAIALTEAGPVGVDIEGVTHAHRELLDFACHPTEREAIVTAEDFAVAWVRKEAVLKADGAGLRCDPTTVVVSAPREKASLRSMPGRVAAEVQLSDFEIDGGLVGAVACITLRPIEIDVEVATPVLAAVSPRSA